MEGARAEECAARAATAAAAGYSVRVMTAADVSAVAAVHVSVWCTAYRGLLPRDYLASLDVDEFADAWRSRLADPSRAASDVVGLSPDGSIVALGSAGRTRDPDPPAPWELWALNVLAHEHGSGLADLMMHGLVADRDCSLWVLEGNARGCGFYRRHGFRADGQRKPVDLSGAAELRMVRRSEGGSG